MGGLSLQSRPAHGWADPANSAIHPRSAPPGGTGGRGEDRATDFVTNAAKLGRSTTLCTSRPNPSGPGAARTGWAKLIPAISTDNDGTGDWGLGPRAALVIRDS